MIKFIDQHASKIIIAALIGGIYLAHPAYADDASTEVKSGAAVKTQDSQNHVEKRIKSLHDKLGITAEQETQWAAVAKVMRENEAAIHELAEQRHENEDASAVDDLKSYEGIADAHADGLKRLIPVFEDLYNSLSDKQKTNADSVFGKFEGHSGHKSSKPPVSKEEQ